MTGGVASFPTREGEVNAEMQRDPGPTHSRSVAHAPPKYASDERWHRRLCV